MNTEMPFQVVHNNPSNVAPDTSSYSVNSKIMIVAIVVLFGVVMFILGLHVYAKWFWRGAGANSGASGGTWRRRRRLEFAADMAGQARSIGQVGLDEALVEKLPTFVFDQKKGHDGAMECAVCLEEFVEGEEGRLLPKCSHSFHIECIGIWLQSHSTCPLCRCSVVPDPPTESSSAELSVPPRDPTVAIVLSESQVCNPNVDVPGSGEEVFQGVHAATENMPVTDSTEASAPRLSSSGFSPKQSGVVQYPANVLFWGNQSQMNVGSGLHREEALPTQAAGMHAQGCLVIEIPRGSVSTPVAGDEPSRLSDAQSGPKSPISRLVTTSFRRLLSIRRGAISPQPEENSSCGNYDFEQGAARPSSARQS